MQITAAVVRAPYAPFAIETLELALLRGTRPQSGAKGLAEDFARFRSEHARFHRKETSSLHASEKRARLNDLELDRIQVLIAALQAALAQGARRPGASGPAVTRGVALAALSVLGEEGRGRTLMRDAGAGSCLHMAKLNLYQCLASAGPRYEDIYCLGQHAMIDPGQCVVEATRSGRQVALAEEHPHRTGR